MTNIISVIIPIYDVEAYIDCCIKSIINQSYKKLEIILVDDGSPDRCPQICDEWAKRDRRIKVVHKENGGLSSARNAGLDICTGDFIAFVDSDDWIKQEMFQTMMDAVEEEKADICACNIISCYPEKEIVWGAKEKIVGDAPKMLDLLYSDSAFPVCSWNKIYRKELWDNFRFPEGKICEDAFTTYLLLDRSDRIVQLTDPLYCYRIRANSIMTSEFSHKSMDEEEAWRKNYEYMGEHYPKLYRKAFTFYLQSVNVLLHRIKDEQKNHFHEDYEYLRKVLKNGAVFMLFWSTASIKYRIRYLLDTIQWLG